MTVWFGLHLWCGFGVTGGLFPEVRLGILRIGCCRGAVGDRMRDARARLEHVYARLVQRGEGGL
jgi:hypothetical protein